MILMYKIMKSTLDNVNEGIVIINEDLEILYWNNYMKYLTSMNIDKVFYRNIYDVLPGLDKKYFKDLIHQVAENDSKMFFSAAMHKDLINSKRKLNLKISKLEEDGKNCILFEFIDVTSQFFRINHLKEYVNGLYILNEELKEKEKTINNLAYYDSLTGLANRTMFYKMADKFYNNSKRNELLLALMFIDVNKFKNINDTYGHKIGDEVLKEVGKVLINSTREGDIAARFGGDEFLVLLPFIKKYEDIKVITSRILDIRNKSFKLGENEINISLSLGVSVYPKDGDTIDELITKADKKMYIEKRNGYK
jgi:diguanylate cyclase